MEHQKAREWHQNAKNLLRENPGLAGNLSAETQLNLHLGAHPQHRIEHTAAPTQPLLQLGLASPLPTSQPPEPPPEEEETELPEGWEEYTNKAGKKYYHHSETNRVTWAYPQPSGRKKQKVSQPPEPPPEPPAEAPAAGQATSSSQPHPSSLVQAPAAGQATSSSQPHPSHDLGNFPTLDWALLLDSNGDPSHYQHLRYPNCFIEFSDTVESVAEAGAGDMATVD
jgi:hypothetical protein